MIIDAAGEAFAESGLSVPVNQIAKRAGVSPATFYRHFRSRTDVVEAVFDMRVNNYLAIVEKFTSEPDAHAAFRQMIHGLVEIQARDRSFREILAALDEIPYEHAGFVRFGELLFANLERARRAGALRPDVNDSDVTMMLLCTETVARPTAMQSTLALRRLVDLWLDGLCGESTDPPVSELDHQQLFDITKRV